jgi:hypothetical protein
VLLQRLKTHKLFYNKWPIKIECHLQGSRFVTYSAIKNCLYQDQHQFEIGEFINSFQPFKHAEFRLRRDCQTISIFLKDMEIAQQICSSMKKWVRVIVSPDTKEELDFLITNNKKVLTNFYPKGIYRYRVYLNSNMKVTDRLRFYNHLNRWGNKFSCSKSTERWLSTSTRYMDNPFFYAEDQSSVSMCCLILGSNIQKIEEFILRSDINTLCQI